MDKIIGVIGGVPQTKSRCDDDFSDRLSHRYTTALLVVFAVIVSTKQYVGDQINCWCPAHFSGNWESYTNSYCWVRNTYYLPFDRYIPKEHEDEDRHMITYYQWVPIILLVMALLFYLPTLVWRSLNSRSGIDLDSIISCGKTFQNTDQAENREKNLNAMSKQMDRYLTSQKDFKTSCTISLKHLFSRTCCVMCGRRQGNYLVVLYLFCKIIYIANVLIQLFALNAFMGHTFSAYGIDVIKSLANGEDWVDSYRFPRVTMCDFKVRRLGNVQRYTVQCVLPINLFNEKIFLFVWFWMVFVAAVGCFSLLNWALRVAFAGDGQRYVKKHLRLMDKVGSNLSNPERTRLSKFLDYLKQDGVFILRLVGHNTNAITVTEFVCDLWDKFLTKDMDEIDDSVADL